MKTSKQTRSGLRKIRTRVDQHGWCDAQVTYSDGRSVAGAVIEAEPGSDGFLVVRPYTDLRDVIVLNGTIRTVELN